MPQTPAPPSDFPKEIDFFWHDVGRMVAELLTDSRLQAGAKACGGMLWSPQDQVADKPTELNVCEWWHTAARLSQSEVSGFSIAPVILSADGCCQDFRGKLSIKPINVSVGNFPGEVNRTDASKRVLGYWPGAEVSKHYTNLMRRAVNTHLCAFRRSPTASSGSD